MIDDKKPLALGSLVPGIDASINGAPPTMPGTASGGKGSTTSSHPVTTTETEANSTKVNLQNAGAPGTPNSAPKLRDNPMREATMGYDMQIQTLREAAERYAPETEEERKKRERKEKSRKIIAAVSDGISALSNLYFTSQYAPNMYHHERSSQLSPLEQRLEQAKAERQKNADRYLDISLKIGDLNNARAATVRELEAQQEARRLAREEAQRKQQEHQWKALLQPEEQREAKGKADKAGYEAITAGEEAKFAPKMQEEKLRSQKAQTEQRRAAAGASRASAANSYAQAKKANRSNPYEYRGLGADGKWYPFEDRQPAIDFERRQGTYNPTRWGDDVEEVTEGGYQGKITKKKQQPTKKSSPTAGGKKSPTS